VKLFPRIQVTDNFKITFPERGKQTQIKKFAECDVIGLELEIAGEPVCFRIYVGEVETGLANIVPLARFFSDKITQKVLEKMNRQARSVPCRPGCATCCNYLVPLSVPEAFGFLQEVLEMPTSHQKLVQRLCLLKARQILRKTPPEKGVVQTRNLTLENSAIGSPYGLDYESLSRWYNGLKLSCPFLGDGICTIYKNRPLACREHYVTGSRCGYGESEKLELPVRMPEVLGLLASELEGRSVEAVMLPLALLWYEQNSFRSKRRWPAKVVASHFAEIVKNTVSQKTAVMNA